MNSVRERSILAVRVAKFWTAQGTNQNAPFHPGPVQPYNKMKYPTCHLSLFSRYTREPFSECAYLENTSDKWDQFHDILRESGAYNYFIPCHRKYRGQKITKFRREYNRSTPWEG